MSKVIKLKKSDYVERPLFNQYWRDKWGTTIASPKVN